VRTVLCMQCSTSKRRPQLSSIFCCVISRFARLLSVDTHVYINAQQTLHPKLSRCLICFLCFNRLSEQLLSTCIHLTACITLSLVQGIACVEGLAGFAAHVNYDVIPGVVYTHPEVATVGKTEEELKEAGVQYSKGSFPFSANSRARCTGSAEGLIKVCTVSDACTRAHSHQLATCV
jgi:Pyridine nucleotide-disulphide oxidoreductase, dimerisation domain